MIIKSTFWPLYKKRRRRRRKDVRMARCYTVSYMLRTHKAHCFSRRFIFPLLFADFFWLHASSASVLACGDSKYWMAIFMRWKDCTIHTHPETNKLTTTYYRPILQETIEIVHSWHHLYSRYSRRYWGRCEMMTDGICVY